MRKVHVNIVMKVPSKGLHKVYYRRNLIFGEGFRFLNFLKPSSKGNILQSESEKGVNSILITILHFWQSFLEDWTFCLTASFLARWKEH